MTPFGDKMARKRKLEDASAASNSAFATPARPSDRGDEMGPRVSRHHADDDSTAKPGFMDHK